MRTTVTIDPDVERRLREAMRTRNLSFKEALNQAVRRGLDLLLAKPQRQKLRTPTFKLGLRPGLSYDNVEELLDRAEGRMRR